MLGAWHGQWAAVFSLFCAKLCELALKLRDGQQWFGFLIADCEFSGYLAGIILLDFRFSS